LTDVGKLWTAAKWMRHFIRNHPEYKHDSAVTQSINYDLVRAVEKITKGQGREEGLGKEFLGHFGVNGYDVGKKSNSSSPKIKTSSPKMNGSGINE
jgi:Glutamate-cysteine ligase